MSRYELHSDKYNIAVGWDKPLRTFFAIVEIPDIPENYDKDPVIAWIGYDYDAIKSIEPIQKLVTDHSATIPKDIINKLQRDSKEPFTSSPMQTNMEKLFHKYKNL